MKEVASCVYKWTVLTGVRKYPYNNTHRQKSINRVRTLAGEEACQNGSYTKKY